ncbi:hypothetical protein M9H77_09446 [Catharanthus roseus]|uniref:Uncharacterized protein n=1 Tax=Catharanthus roseus TaxID=4058 RepID=A0ACC0C0P3_CATRO|nr:hypothetical protein M9H77_09446 [Catharanthus roseus]
MYRDITRVYIGNPTNRDTQTIGYQSAGTSMLHEIDDMATGILICRCMVSIGGTLDYAPSQHDIQQTFLVQATCCLPQKTVPDRGAHEVKRAACRLPGGGARGGCALAPPHPVGQGHANPECGGERGEGSRGRGRGGLGPYDHDDSFDSSYLDIPTFSLGLTPPTQSHPGGLCTSYAPPISGTVGSSIQAPPHLSLGIFFISRHLLWAQWVLHFRHLLLREAADEHDDERTDDVKRAHQLGLVIMLVIRLLGSRLLIGPKNPSFYVFRNPSVYVFRGFHFP